MGPLPTALCKHFPPFPQKGWMIHRRSVSLVSHQSQYLWYDVEMFAAVNVEVCRAVECHEEVRDVSNALHPWRPRALVVHGETAELVQVRDPLHRVAHNEN